MRSRVGSLALAFAAGLLAVPTTAWANTGTPLVWLMGIHLLVGNALIGLVEGALLRRFFAAPAAVTYGVMVAANYVSSAAGLVVIPSLSKGLLDRLLGDTPIYHLGRCFWAIGIGLFAITVLLEWPFVAAALGMRKRWLLVSLGASLAVQTASYGALVPLYLRASHLSLLREVRPDPSLLATSPNRGWVYFGSGVGQFRIRLDGTGLEQVPEPRLDTTRPRQGKAIDLRPEGERRCEVWAGQVFVHGALTVKQAGTWRSFSLETPLLNWSAGGATVLPGDQVVYECGPQIVLLDIPTRRIAFLARGRNAVVKLDP